MLPDWFFNPVPPAPLPPPALPPTTSAPTAIPGQESLMNVDWTATTGEDGTAYVEVPIPPGTTHIVAASADVLDANASVPPHHDEDIDQVDAAGPLDASGVICQPCVGAQTPGTQRVRVAGAIPDHFYSGHCIFA
jgi:hypothetical protein